MDIKLIDQAVSIFNQGGIVIYPTDTAFGIGCRIDKPEAIKRLLNIKQKSLNSPLPVLVASVTMAEKYFIDPLPLKIKELMIKYWPGGLTIVYKSNLENVSSIVMGEKNTIGLRMPDYIELLKIIEKLGVPIVGTSANLSGQKTPYLFSDLDQKITNQVDLVLPGKCKSKLASTVVDCTKEPWKILRQGAVKIL